jgi:integrase
MAGVRKKGNGYHCTFRFRGQRFYFALGDVTEEQARARGVEVDEILGLIERGRLTVPDGVPLEDFVAAGGKVPVVSARPETTTARQLFDRYLETHANGTVEDSSLRTARTHLNQLAGSVGDRFRIQSLTLADLQAHLERRRRRGVSPVTLRKEVATLRACWNWAVHGGALRGTFPGRGLRFPKEEEKEPFRTFAEIEAIIAAEDADDARQEQLWEALYLTRPEVEELLGHVRANGTLPWVFPVVAFAAYTGARRSEMLRALATDVDLAGGTVTIREKKRVKGKQSTRTAPITPKLAAVLGDWLAVRPASPFLFCQAQRVSLSKTRREGPTAVTRDEAHDHFKRTVEGSKWEVLRGYHVLRHSFISALASEGVDQRVIDEEWKPFLESVRTSGVQDPLTVQKGGRVLDGRHRLKAAKESGQETVPARVVDLSPEDQTALVYHTALLRRHLGDDQRAMLAARWTEAECKKSRSERARKAGLAGGRGRDVPSWSDTSCCSTANSSSCASRSNGVARWRTSTACATGRQASSGTSPARTRSTR